MADRTDDFYASDAELGYGAQLLMGDGASPEVFEAVAFVTSITPGGSTTAAFDRTHLRSPDRHREKGAGIRDTSPFSMKMIFAPNEESQSEAGGGTGPFQTGGLLYVVKNGLTKNWEIRLVDGTTLALRGFVSEYTIGEISVENKIDLTVQITPVQSQTLTPAA